MTRNTHRYTTHATGRREKVPAGDVGILTLMVVIAAMVAVCAL